MSSRPSILLGLTVGALIGFAAGQICASLLPKSFASSWIFAALGALNGAAIARFGRIAWIRTMNDDYDPP